MKKFLAIFLAINILTTPALAIETIVDRFVEKTLPKDLRADYSQNLPIVDKFAQSSLKNYPKPEISLTAVLDNIADKNLKNAKFDPYYSTFLNYDYTSIKRVEIPIKVENLISTKDDLIEGQYIEFKTTKPIKINEDVLPENAIVKARIEMISKAGYVGVPADLALERFSLNYGGKIYELYGTINKVGANRMLWVYPLAQGANCFFFSGMALMLIKGGHAKLKPSEVFTVYYRQ